MPNPKWSPLWRYFDDVGSKEAKCKIDKCPALARQISTSKNTTNLWQHLPIHHPKEFKDLEMGNHKSIPFPLMSGKFDVGCVDLFTLAYDGNLIRLYYPCEEQTSYNTPWLPKPDYVDGIADFLKSRPFLFRFLFNGGIGNPLIRAFWGAPILPVDQQQPSRASFPVVVFSHGLGACRTTYSTICCDLASHGYVVAAVEHRDGSACRSFKLQSVDGAVEEKPIFYEKLKPFEREFKQRNRQVQERSNECVKALHLLEGLNMGRSESLDSFYSKEFDFGCFKNRLSMENVALVGHSFGGATVLQALSADDQFRVGVVLDGWMFPLHNDKWPAIKQPVLFVNMEAFQWKENLEQMSKFLNSDATRDVLTIKGSVHQSQTDFTFLIPRMFSSMLQSAGSIDPLLCNEINNSLLVAFLSENLGISSSVPGFTELRNKFSSDLNIGIDIDDKCDDEVHAK